MVLLQFRRALMVLFLVLFGVGSAQETLADSGCTDTKFRFEVGGGKRMPCSSLKSSALRSKHCSTGLTIDTQADAVCPKTCGKCNVQCSDSAKADFGTRPNGKKKTCRWLKMSTTGKACTQDKIAPLVCPETCGRCPASKPMPKPMPEPVPKPMPVPKPVPKPAPTPNPRPNLRPTHPPAPRPTQRPTKETLADSGCTDTKFRFEVGGGKRMPCSLLESSSALRSEHCSSGPTIDTQADAVCPKTCGKCNVPCSDSAKADFGTRPNGKKKTCGWLKMSTTGKACTQDKIAPLVCPETCGRCPAPKPVPKPVPAPTTRPNPRPTPPPAPRPTWQPTDKSGSGGDSFPPGDPPQGYREWNYNPNDGIKGPGAWHNIENRDVAKLPDYKYWKQYEEEMEKQLPKGFNHNYCQGYDQSQSPIDLNDIDGVNTECFEYHQLRDKPGDYALISPNVKMEILPNKLRIRWPGKLDGANPTCDIPKGWGNHYPVLHADVVIKSAHTIDSRQFPAEYQLWVLTNRGRGMAVITTLIDEGMHNSHFETAIQEWEQKFEEDESGCRLRDQRELRGGSFNTTEQNQQDDSLPAPQVDSVMSQKQAPWDPFHPSIFTSNYWWGYRGTTMEPPCYPLTEYQVLDSPMYLSKDQLRRLRGLLFMHRDGDNGCKLTSNHHEGNSARPVQPRMGRDLHRCTCIDYYPDKKRKRTGARDCKADMSHPWYKKDCPEWYEGNGGCPSWYEG